MRHPIDTRLNDLHVAVSSQESGDHGAGQSGQDQPQRGAADLQRDGDRRELLCDFNVAWVWDHVQDPCPLEDGSFPDEDDTRLTFGLGWSFESAPPRGQCGTNS